MKTKTLLLMLAMSGVMIFTSCKKDDPSPLSKEDAQAELISANTDFTDIKGEFDASEGSKMLSTIDNMNLPFDVPMKSPSTSKGFKDGMMKIAKPEFAKTLGEGDAFLDIDWAANVGTWTWNESTSSWNHITTPANKIVLVFPYNTGTATLTFYNYATKTYSYDSETYTYISGLSFKAEYTVSSTTTTVYSWEYTASRGMLNGNLKFVYTLGAFSQTESYSVSTSGSTSSLKMTISMLFEVKKNGDTIFAESATLVVAENQSGYTVAINAKVRLLGIVVKWDINWNHDTDMTNPNNYMKVSVWTTGGAKIADIILILEGEEYVAYFEYKDGTREKVTEKLGSGENSIFNLLGGFIDGVMGSFKD